MPQLLGRQLTKDYKLIYLDGVATNTGVYDVGFGAATAAAGSNTQVQFNSSGAFAGSANLIFDGTNVVAAGTVTAQGGQLSTTGKSFVMGF